MARVTEIEPGTNIDNSGPDMDLGSRPSSRLTFHVSRLTFHVSRFLPPAAVTSFLTTRLVVGLAAWMGVSDLIRSNPATYHKGPLVEAALLWDAAWYLGIAQDGYIRPSPTVTSNLAFPPLLPLLVR